MTLHVAHILTSASLLLAVGATTRFVKSLVTDFWKGKNQMELVEKCSTCNSVKLSEQCKICETLSNNTIRIIPPPTGEVIHDGTFEIPKCDHAKQTRGILPGMQHVLTCNSCGAISKITPEEFEATR